MKVMVGLFSLMMAAATAVSCSDESSKEAEQSALVADELAPMVEGFIYSKVLRLAPCPITLKHDRKYSSTTSRN